MLPGISHDQWLKALYVLRCRRPIRAAEQLFGERVLPAILGTSEHYML